MKKVIVIIKTKLADIEGENSLEKQGKEERGSDDN